MPKTIIERIQGIADLVIKRDRPLIKFVVNRIQERRKKWLELIRGR